MYFALGDTMLEFLLIRSWNYPSLCRQKWRPFWKDYSSAKYATVLDAKEEGEGASCLLIRSNPKLL